MAEVLLRLSGVIERVLNTLVKKGYYKTKSEALRAGILELGKEYAIIESPAYHRKEIEKEAQRKKITMKAVMEAVEKLEE